MQFLEYNRIKTLVTPCPHCVAAGVLFFYTTVSFSGLPIWVCLSENVIATRLISSDSCAKGRAPEVWGENKRS
jgi:hypothetical protein